MAETNVFADAFLETLNKRYPLQYPVTLEPGRWNVPWEVRREDSQHWHLVRNGGNDIEATTELRETAYMLAALYPFSFDTALAYGMDNEPGRELQWTLKTYLGDRGYATVGRLKCGREELLIPLHVAYSLLTSPTSLAFLLAAAPPEVLVQVGELVAKRMSSEED